MIGPGTATVANAGWIDAISTAIGSQAAHEGRGTADRGEYRQAAGAISQIMNALRVYLVKSHSSDKSTVVPNRW
jgi:hypothetical protein